MDLPSYDPDAVEGEDAEVDFKAQFDPSSRQDWCELVKDIVAMANSGGGVIVIGVNDDGTVSGHDIGPVLEVDLADVTNKIHSYTETQFSMFRICEGTRHGAAVAIIRIAGVRVPMIFTSPGTYPAGSNSQKTAFGRGTVYFRHGPKSEPGTCADLAAAVDREVSRLRTFWMDGIAKVVAAPPGSTVQIVQHRIAPAGARDAAPIRLSTDENAPAFHAVQADELYPYRQTELVTRLRERLKPRAVSSHDVLCVRRIFGTDDDPTFSYKAQWSPRQYSDAFVEWIVQQYSSDPSFFEKARESYRRQTTMAS
ncbi:MAG: hypothetical protein GEU99_22010 [Luteitalea sp.]|nr:hypothetical protein [Luteitalea sp.]